MSVEIISLTLRNFLSYGNNETEIDLTFAGTTLVLGENLDRGGANGVGKTTVANGISYALYDKAVSKISKEKLINTTNNSKHTDMIVTLDFKVDGVNYSVKRARGAHPDTRLYIEGEDKTPDSIDNTNKAIADIVGLSYEMFCKTVVFTGGSGQFFDLPVSAQRGMIEELFKITVLSEKAETLKKLNSDVDKDIDVQTSIEKAKELRVKHISDAEARIIKWETDRSANLAAIQSRIDLASTIDFEQEELLISELERINGELRDANTINQRFSKELSQLNVSITKDENDLKHLEEAKCPFCLQDFEGAMLKIDEITIRLQDARILYSTTMDQMKEVSGLITDLTAQSREIKSVVKFQSLSQLMTEKSSATQYQHQYNTFEKSVNPHLEAYETLLQEADVEVDYTRLDELKSELDHQKFMLKLLTSKDSFIRKKLINKSLPFLNKQLYEHSKDLGLPHIVTFNADMTCTISEYGREIDYGNLSGGERNRLNLGLNLAFRDVLQHLHSSINILFADEVDAGAMDVIGVEAIIKTLKKKATQEKDLSMWIISHRPEMIGRFDREMTIRFENGFAAISKIETL